MCWHKWSVWSRVIPIIHKCDLAQWRTCMKCNKQEWRVLRTPQGDNANLIEDVVKECRIKTINKEAVKL